MEPDTLKDFRDVLQTAQFLEGYRKPWAFCGGWAIDLFIGHVTRSHKDVDLAILRTDQLILQKYLSSQSWSLDKAVDGELIPWQADEFIQLPIHTIWCKNLAATSDFFEVLLNESDSENFLFRRNVSIRLPLRKAIIMSVVGVPIIAPEIALLYKSSNINETKNVDDFNNALPYLSVDQRSWLENGLRKISPEHIWIKGIQNA